MINAAAGAAVKKVAAVSAAAVAVVDKAAAAVVADKKQPEKQLTVSGVRFHLPDSTFSWASSYHEKGCLKSRIMRVWNLTPYHRVRDDGHCGEGNQRRNQAEI